MNEASHHTMETATIDTAQSEKDSVLNRPWVVAENPTDDSNQATIEAERPEDFQSPALYQESETNLAPTQETQEQPQQLESVVDAILADTEGEFGEEHIQEALRLITQFQTLSELQQFNPDLFDKAQQLQVKLKELEAGDEANSEEIKVEVRAETAQAMAAEALSEATDAPSMSWEELQYSEYKDQSLETVIVILDHLLDKLDFKFVKQHSESIQTVLFRATELFNETQDQQLNEKLQQVMEKLLEISDQQKKKTVVQVTALVRATVSIPTPETPVTTQDELEEGTINDQGASASEEEEEATQTDRILLEDKELQNEAVADSASSEESPDPNGADSETTDAAQPEDDQTSTEASIDQEASQPEAEIDPADITALERTTNDQTGEEELQITTNSNGQELTLSIGQTAALGALMAAEHMFGSKRGLLGMAYRKIRGNSEPTFAKFMNLDPQDFAKRMDRASFVMQDFNGPLRVSDYEQVSDFLEDRSSNELSTLVTNMDAESRHQLFAGEVPDGWNMGEPLTLGQIEDLARTLGANAMEELGLETPNFFEYFASADDLDDLIEYFEYSTKEELLDLIDQDEDGILPILFNGDIPDGWNITEGITTEDQDHLKNKLGDEFPSP